MMRRKLSFTVAAVLLGAGALTAQDAPGTQAPEAHIEHASPAPATNSSPAPFIQRGEPIVAVMGCLMESHDEAAHGALVLGQVQRGSISVAGITAENESSWVVVRESEGDVSQGADANPTHTMDSSGMLTRTEYPVAPGQLDLRPYLDQQVRMTGVFRSADGHTTLHVLRVSPIGALCAGAH